MSERDANDIARKARELWWRFTDSERCGVAFGIFPHAAMQEAEQAGYEPLPLVRALR